MGEEKLPKVNEKHGLSPGILTVCMCKYREFGPGRETETDGDRERDTEIPHKPHCQKAFRDKLF